VEDKLDFSPEKEKIMRETLDKNIVAGLPRRKSAFVDDSTSGGILCPFLYFLS